MKKAAFIAGGIAWAAILENLLKKDYIIDIYTESEEPLEIDGIRAQFRIKTHFNPKCEKALKQYNQELQSLTKDKEYDIVFSPHTLLECGCSVLHFNSVPHRKRILANCIERLFFHLGHKSLIEYYSKFNKALIQKVFVVSSNLKEDYSRNCNIPKEKIVVVHPGNRFANLSNINKTSYSDSNDFIFGLSATGFSRKGGYIMLRAMRRLSRKYPNVKCKVIYPGYKKNSFISYLVKLLNLSDKVEFLGHQKDISEFYMSLNSLIMPSKHEAFGLVAVEAMSHKTPVIVSSCSGVTDIITDGENGFIFNVSKNAANNLAEKMEYVMLNYNQLDECIEKAVETARDCTWKNFHNTILDTLEEIK